MSSNTVLALYLHASTSPLLDIAMSPTPPERTIQQALNLFHEVSLKLMDGIKEDLKILFHNIVQEVKDILCNAKPIKWYLCLTVKFNKLPNFKYECSTVSLDTPIKLLLSADEIDDQIQDSLKQLEEKVDEYINKGSGWILDHVDAVKVNYASYKPLAPKSYIPTPKELASKRAIVNVRNNDNECFKWSVLASLHPVIKSPNRISHYKPYSEELNFKNISFPVQEKDIAKFERLNDISVNVFGYEKEVFIIRASSFRKARHNVDLLLLKSNKKSHYCWIKNFSRLMRSSVTKHKEKTFFCRFCLLHFTSEELLKTHSEMCREQKFQKVTLPTDREIISFKEYKFMVPVPFTVYFDIECLVLPPANHGNTRKHEPYAYCFIVVDEKGSLYENKIHEYRGQEPIKHFLKALLSKAKELSDVLLRDEPQKMSKQDEENFRQATTCILCELPLGDDRVRDHCHITGKYRAAIHYKCNLRYAKVKHIPVISHNLMGYDSHFIIQHLGELGLNIKCIPKTIETYLSFSVYLNKNTCLRFIDSMQFLNGSLEKLTDTLTSSNWPFSILRSVFPDRTLAPLLMKKGVFPYEYSDDENKMKDTKLPPIEKFYSSLKLETVTEEQYKHAQNIWKRFNISNLEEYLMLYLRTDVLLLAEVFQSFRKTCYDNFQLDPLHFFSTPGLTWQAFLKLTKAQIKPFTDSNMHLFVESGIRGGISSVGNIRRAKSNDPRDIDYNSTKPSSTILNLDKNNLYGGALSEPMPLKNFRFLTNEEIENLDILSVPKSSPKGYILETDLTYPQELHDKHNMYPMAPEKIPVTSEMLSTSTLNKLKNLKLPLPTEKNIKLVPNFRDKHNYVCHYRNLQFYVKHGLRLVRVHKILEFDQDNYINSYINRNTINRRNSKSAVERDFYKLCNNALYGKTLENVRNRINVTLVSNQKKAQRLINSATFKSFRIFSNNLVAVHSHKKNIILNKPIFIGFAVLELSKLFMYEFLYEDMIPTFGNRINLLLTDTDSFIFHIKSINALQEIKDKLASKFDLSNFPHDHLAYTDENKGVVNKMKIEFPNNIIREVIALRPKMYSILFAEDEREKKVAKGVQRAVINHRLKHAKYRNSLKKACTYRTDMSRILNRAHEISTLTYSKISLSPFDDKRYYKDPADTKSLAHFHYKCNRIQ